MGWGSFLGNAAMGVMSYLGAKRQADSADNATALQSAITQRLLGIGAQGGADLEQAYADELAAMGGAGRFDAGTFAGLQDAFYRRNMDAADRSLGLVSSKARADSLSRGLGSSTYDIELKKGLADTGAQLGQKAYFDSFDQATGYLNNLAGLRKSNLAEVATVVGGPAAMRMGAPTAALGPATTASVYANKQAGEAATGFGSALTKTFDRNDEEWTKMWGDLTNLFGSKKP